VRSLVGVIEAPALRPDGSILERVGYGALTGLYLHLGGPAPAVPDAPNAAEVRAALDLLLGLVADFPFARPEHRSAWLAFLLTPLARHAFAGPAPLFLVDSNTQGQRQGPAV
jgi:hypothetical protein